ncbi:MAG: IclR family transcriptional regulator [Woeseiaceae bacterium]
MKTNRSVERAMSVLMYVCQGDNPMGLTDISRGAGLDKATTLRLLNTLANMDLVRQRSDDRNYVPGGGIYNFWPNEVRKICRPHLQSLLEQTQETVCLIVPRGKQRVCIDVIEPDRELRIVAPVGRAVPVYAGAAGRVFMAQKTDLQVREILSEDELTALTNKSVTDRDLYCQQLDEVRANGCAYSVDEVELDTSAIAVPVFDGLRNTVAAVVVRGPGSRMAEDTVASFIPDVKACAAAISEDLASTQD